MHETAYAVGRAFFASYVRAGDSILEIGSLDVNGSLRDFCPAGSHYIGTDLAAGPSVDVVSRAADLPFADGSFDAVVSSSCFEHDGMFWLTFLDICRVLKGGGYIYINAPSRGDYHTFPIDAWRFFPDAGMALAAWARRGGQDVNLLESFIAEGDDFGDCVMILGKQAPPPPVLVAQRYRDKINVRTWPNLDTLARRADRWPRPRTDPGAARTQHLLAQSVTDDAIAIVRDCAAPVRRCLEWSSGGTAAMADYAISRASEFFLSIDHVGRRQREAVAGIPKHPSLHFRVIECDDWPDSSVDMPNIDYITYPLSLGVEFDTIVVAGRWRMQCAVAASRVIAPGGLVIVLDEERVLHRALRRFFGEDGSTPACTPPAVLARWRQARDTALHALYESIEERNRFTVLRATPGSRTGQAE